MSATGAPSRPTPELLQRFLGSLPETPVTERAALLGLAQALLDGVYVHLRQKRARYGIDPVQQLRVLRQRSRELSSAQFHDELRLVFTALRDRHTGYLAPAPLAGKVAVLPLLLERYTDEHGRPRFLVSRRPEGWAAETDLRPGDEVTHWNGIPIVRAVEQNARHQRGANDAARLARGLVGLTTRSLQHSAPPDEHWVILTGRTAGRRTVQSRLRWRVIDAAEVGDTRAAASLDDAFDPAGRAVQDARRQLYAPGRAEAPWLPTSLPEVFAARPIPTRAGERGYVRIWTFAHRDDRELRDEACRLLALLPPDGVIVDIRGNPGGNVLAAERLLQALTPRHVRPVEFSLTTTDATLEMCLQDEAELGRWTDSIRSAVTTGEAYSQAFALTAEETANDLAEERRYPGPAVLIVDALTYSAADIFAAGFHDNGLGEVVGTDATTGAGGANVWTSAQVAARAGGLDGWPALPESGASFTVALRRATRVGGGAGLPIEDIGVRATHVHRTTRRDLLHGNEDLLAAAARRLEARRRA